MNDKAKKGKILFIDDEKICHTLVQLIIPNFTDFELISAHNGKEAFELAARYAGDIVLVLTDIAMPDYNGFEIYDELKAKSKFKDVPFIFQSGYSNKENELLAHIKGEKPQILYKPYKQQDLLAAIDNCIS